MPNTAVSNWKPLYRLGAAAALLAVFVFRRNLGAEFTAFNGFGIFHVPSVPPVRAEEWFALLHSDRFVGLTLLEMFDLVEYALLGLAFLAVCAALWKGTRGLLPVAVVCGLLGVAVYFATNPAFAMAALSDQYAAAAGETQRAAFAAAGEALLAANSVRTGLFLVLLAGLMISVIMLRSSVFSKLTAIAGILANGFGLLYFLFIAIAPALVALPFVLSAPFRLVWYFLIALKLLQLARAESIQPAAPARAGLEEM